MTSSPPRAALLTGWVGLWALYALTLSRWLTHADSPEFAALYAMGGFAHPPGYPTVVLIYRAFAWLPFDPRIGAGLVTAAVGAFAILVLYRACLAWGASRWGALAAAGLVGLNAQVWLVHTHPEAFAFNNLFAALLLWLSAPEGPCRGARRAAALGLTGGLALGAHHSIVLLAPVGLWGIWLSVREARRASLALVAAGGACGAALSVYAYPLLVDSAVSFGRIDTVGGLVDHFLRREYGTTKLAAQGESSVVEQWGFWLVEAVTDFAVVGFLLGLAGIAEIVRSVREQGRAAAPKLVLLAAWLLAGPVFLALFNVSPQGPDHEIVKRFHVLPAVLMGPMIAFGVARLTTIRPRVLVASAALVAVVMLASGILRTSRVYDATIEDWLANALVTAPPDAIFLTQGDHRYFAGQYLQEVEGLRPDVANMIGVMLGLPWYVERMRERTGLDLPAPVESESGGRTIELRRAIDALRDSGRPVIVTRDWAEEVLAEYPMVPHGVGFRLLRTGEPEPSAAQLVATNAQIYGDFVHRSPPPVYVGNRWGWSVYNSYTSVWRDLEERCIAAADPCIDVARSMLERYPDL